MKCHRLSGRSVRPVSVCTIADALTIGSPRDKVVHAAYVAGHRAKSLHSIGKFGPSHRRVQLDPGMPCVVERKLQRRVAHGLPSVARQRREIAHQALVLHGVACPAVGNKREPPIGSKGERCQAAALAKSHPDVAERGIRDVDCAEAMRHVCKARVDGEVLRRNQIGNHAALTSHLVGDPIAAHEHGVVANCCR
eukprot:scaffold83174_cov63-Phaeocystis_antarctica.AAC.1